MPVFRTLLASGVFRRLLPRCGRRGVLLALALGACLGSAAGQATDFADLSLEQLTHYDITTLGRKNATVFDTPAGSDVISGDEIHQSGATSLPEALRLAAGVQVSRIDSLNYAISVRGFDDATSSKLLLLMDGRVVYNQLLGGTDWALLDLMLDDVNRIEVQRGPAGTLWGANAVNGVINIVSKNAHSTLGAMASVIVGDELKTSVAVREGFEITPAAALRIYAKYQSQGDYGAGGDTGILDSNSRLAGTRFDWDRPGGGGLSVIAEYRELRVDSNTGLPDYFPPDYSLVVPEQRRERSGDLTAHWTQPVTDDGELSVLTSLDRGNSEQFVGDERHTTSNVDAQATLHPLKSNEVIAGATFRSTSDRVRNSPWLIYDTPAATTNFYGIFLQDEVTIVPEVFTVTAGAKIERNTFTGWETQPSIRALWHPTPNQALWAAISLAARTPSRAERGVHYFAAVIPPSADLPLPIGLVANGDPHFSSEHVVSYELGHRIKLGGGWSADTSLFYSRYRDLRGLAVVLLTPDFTAIPPSMVADLDATNSLYGYTAGGEFSLNWKPAPVFELRGSAALVRTHLYQGVFGVEADPSVAGLIGNTPPEEYKLHASWRPFEHWSMDLVGRHTGPLAEASVPSYDGLDARIGWALRPNLELELVGQDLLKPTHLEISSEFIGMSVRPIARSFFVRVTYRH